MKKLVFIITMACISIVCVAQTSYLKCIYTETPHVSDQVRQMQNVYLRDMVVSKFKKEKKTFTMYATPGKYLFVKSSNKTEGGDMLIGAVNSIYIDLKSDSIITEKTIIDKSYVIKDIDIPQRWKMTEETRLINGKKCKKAIARGLMKIVAWYTEDIPFRHGPMGYHGLPGLIVELHTPSDIYALKSFEYLKQEPQMKSPAKGKVVTATEFEKLQNDYFARFGEAKPGDVVIVEK